MSNWQEVPQKIQDMMEGLCHPSRLLPQQPGQAAKVRWMVKRKTKKPKKNKQIKTRKVKKILFLPKFKKAAINRDGN